MIEAWTWIKDLIYIGDLMSCVYDRGLDLD